MRACSRRSSIGDVRPPGELMPSRSDIDPAEIPKLLPHVRLVDAVGPGHYKYRLVGTEVRKLHAKDPTGRYLHEAMTGPVGARIIAIYDECVRTRRAIYFEIEFLDDELNGLRRHSKMVFAPLSVDGQVVNQIIVFQVTLAAGRLTKLIFLFEGLQITESAGLFSGGGAPTGYVGRG